METFNPLLFQLHHFLHSDPTYEAWKLSKSTDYKIKVLIPILPTRHGNPEDEEKALNVALIPILPTRHGNLLAPLHSRIVALIPILPTRHGNLILLLKRSYEREIPILPTRHGNHLQSEKGRTFALHSDPTYEAWKLVWFFQNNSLF